MTKKTFGIIIVRHGQGFHNLGIYSRDELVFTNDDKFSTLNSSLTEKGLMQANLVADRADSWGKIDKSKNDKYLK